MNQAQRKYTAKRIDSIYTDAKVAINKRFRTLEKRLSKKDRLTALKEGRFAVLDEPKSNVYFDYLGAYIVFYDEQEGSVDHEKIDRVTKALTNRKQEILDKVMLGDSEEALNAISAFSDFVTGILST